MQYVYLILAVGLSTACGMSPILIRGEPASPSSIAPPSLATLLDFSVNMASATLSGGLIRLQTLATVANPAGSFVGGGTGNKANLGVPDFHQVNLGNFSSISFEGVRTAGTDTPYLNFIVDLDCVLDEDPAVNTLAQYRARRKIIVNSFATQTATTGGYTRFDSAAGDSHWRIVGGALGGLPDISSGSGGRLTDFVAAYPNACLINGISTDGGLGRDTSIGSCVTTSGLPTTALGQCGESTSSILLILGGSSTLTNQEWNIRRIVVNSITYE